jgi:branched-chain amino acid transport system substrate-binding protein
LKLRHVSRARVPGLVLGIAPALLLGASLALFACKSGGGGNVIKIGEFASLTGNTATFGQSSHKGSVLAFEEVNQAGGLLGKPVELVSADDQSKPEEARTAVLKLIRQDGVVAILGEVASSRSLAAAPEAQRAHIPMVSPASTNPQVTQVGDYIFRACFIDPVQGGTMARFAYQDLGVRHAAVLVDVKNDYSVGLADFFVKTFQQLGGQVVARESYSEGDIEFRAQLTKIRETEPQAIFVPGYYTEVGLIAQQARELGITVPLLGGDGWDSPVTLEIGKDAVNGAYFSNHYAADDPSERVQGFIAKFRKRWDGETPDAMAVLGYDAARMLADAIQRAGSTDPQKIRDALAATKDFPGVSGNITMDPERNARKPVVILKIEDGKVHFVKALEP